MIREADFSVYGRILRIYRCPYKLSALVLSEEISRALKYLQRVRTLPADESACIQQTVCIFVIVLLSRDQGVDADFV